MAVQEAQVVALELEKVLPKIAVAFERDDKFFATIERRQVEKVSNRQMRVPIELRPGGDFGYFQPDGSDLGRGGGPTWDKAVLTPVFMKEGIEYTKLTQWATDDSRKAIANAVRRMTADALDEIRKQIDNQMQQAGNGVVGTVSTRTTSGGVDTYVLDSDGFGAKLVRFGQTIQLFDSTLATNRGSGVITSWDVATKTIQVTPAIASSTTTDVLVVNGISAPASLPALYGVPYHHSNASTGTWLGFNRASTPEVRSNRVNGGGALLTLPLPRLALNAVGNRVGIDNNFNPEAWTHPCQAHQYEQMAQAVSIIQKQAKAEGVNLFFSDNMQLAGAPLKQHFSWNMKRIDFIVKDVWGRGEILPLGFYTTDGRRIFEIRGASGGVATADIFYMVIGTQTFVTNPAATSYIDNLAIPAGY